MNLKHNSYIGNQYPAPENKLSKDDIFKGVKKDPARVMASIIRNQTSQYKKEIAHWKGARDEAMNIIQPRRVLLTELYADIELDGFIHGLVHNNRILRVSNKKFKVVNFKTGKEDKDKTDLLQRSWVNKFIKLAMESKFHGYSLVYLNELNTIKKQFSKIELVYREHVVPEFGAWTDHIYGTDYRYFADPPYNNYMLGIGEPENLGLYDKAAPYYILKKHSWANWDEFEEIFGIPIRIAKTASNDKVVLDSIQNWLKTMGTAAYGIFPSDTDMDIKEPKQADAFEVFNRKRQAANEELEILLLGLKNVTQEGGTFGKQEAIRKDQSEVTEDDKLFLYHLMNDELMPLLVRNGYPFTEDDIFVWDDLEKAKPTDRLAIFKGVKELGYTLDQEEVSTELGVNITGEAEPPTPIEEEEEEEQEPDDKPKPGDKKKRKTPAPEDVVKKYTQLHSKLNDLYFNLDTDVH